MVHSVEITMCCYFIVTLRSLLWMVVSLGIVAMHGFALIMPDWLQRLDRPFAVAPASATPQNTAAVSDPGRTAAGLQSDVVISQASALGLLQQCKDSYSLSGLASVPTASSAVYGGVGWESSRHCDWIQSFFELPIWLWMVTVVFYCLGVAILGFVAVMSIFTCCFRSICRKSIFTVMGLIQAIAGLLILLGLVLYPAGWGSDAVMEVCGADAAPFQFGACTLGWSFYVAAGATFLTFACAVLSVQAEIATSSDDVQDEILKGKYVICLA